MIYKLTGHAERRMQQRGVPRELLVLFMDYAEFEASAGSGCTLIRMKRRQLGGYEIDPHRDQLRRLSVIERSGEIITVIRPNRGASGRRYRRGARS